MASRDNLFRGRIASAIGLAFTIKSDESEAPMTRFWARIAHYALRKMSSIRDYTRDGL